MNTTFLEDFSVGVVVKECISEIAEASGVMNVMSGDIAKF